ncbi:hypothetical protein KIN13_08630, partial [Vibrio cholerae]
LPAQADHQGAGRGVARALIFSACTALIAGKPAPTFECVHKSKCGRGLAPDEAVSITLQLKPNAISICANGI